MRAVNLVPKEYRRGSLAGTGGEKFSLFLLGALGLVLVAVLAVVLIGNSISDKKVEKANLAQESADAKAHADALQPYATFASIQQARTATVSSLAQSRFDWERVLTEMSKVIPPNVSLSSLTGTVVPDVNIENASSLSTRDEIPGPALEIVGCAETQEDSAAYAAALEDIDGVTRVGVEESGTPTTGGAGSTAQGCRRPVQFSIVVAFDAAPVPATADGSTLPATPAPAAPAPAPNDGGVGQAQTQQAAQQTDVQGANNKADKATNLIPGS